MSVLHTLGQNALHHPHVHCVFRLVVFRWITSTGSALATRSFYP